MTRIEFYQAKLAFETDAFDLNEALSAGNNVVVVDTRSPEAYDNEHIPFAVNVPHRTITSELTKNWSRAKQYVTYCDGIGCNASTKGALKLAELGFDVRELLGGLDWWRRDGYETEGTGVAVPKPKACGC